MTALGIQQGGSATCASRSDSTHTHRHSFRCSSSTGYPKVGIIQLPALLLYSRQVLTVHFVYSGENRVLKRHLHTCEQGSIILTAKVKATQIPIDEQMNKMCHMWIYSGMLFSLKREGKFSACHNMHEPRGCYAEWNKLTTKRQMMYDSTYMIYPQMSNSQKVKMVAARSWWKVERRVIFSCVQSFNIARWRVLEIQCTTMWMYITLLNGTLKMVRTVNLKLCVFYHNNKQIKTKWANWSMWHSYLLSPAELPEELAARIIYAMAGDQM